MPDHPPVVRTGSCALWQAGVVPNTDAGWMAGHAAAISRMAVWENRDDAKLYREVEQAILDSNGGKIPDVLDPFAGGGAIPLEAQFGTLVVLDFRIQMPHLCERLVAQQLAVIPDVSTTPMGRQETRKVPSIGAELCPSWMAHR